MNKALQSLQGAWQIESLEIAGAPVGASGRITVNETKFTTSGMGAEYSGRLELSNPNKITLHFETGPEAGHANHGIYEITTTGWRLCLNITGGPAPKVFKSSKNHALETLVPAQPAKPVTGHPIPELQGEWQMGTCLRSGEPLLPSFLKSGVRKITGIETTLHFGKQLFHQGTLSQDGPPNTFELQGEGAPQLGIYKLDGDTLTTCLAAPGHPRPGNYESTKEGGQTLTTWRRR